MTRYIIVVITYMIIIYKVANTATNQPRKYLLRKKLRGTNPAILEAVLLTCSLYNSLLW